MKILTHVVPNLYGFISSSEHKRKEYLNRFCPHKKISGAQNNILPDCMIRSIENVTQVQNRVKKITVEGGDFVTKVVF